MPKNKARHASTNSPSGSQDETWESSGSGSEGPGGEGFRVRVDLSAYWGAPAACLLWARAGQVRRVRHLARRLAAAAALRRPFCLLAAGAALAPAEPLCLLRPDDHLRVVPVEHEWQKPFSFRAEDEEASSPAPRRGGAPGPGVGPLVGPAPPPRAPAGTPFSRSDVDSLPPLLTDSTSVADHIPRHTSLGVSDSASEPRPGATSRPAAPESAEGGDAALRSVKRRALALLQRVQAAAEDGAAGGDAGEGAGAGDEADGAPPRKRRRRVRRRRPPPPEPGLESGPAPAPGPEPPCPPAASPDPPAPAEPFASAHHTFQSTHDPAGPPPPAPVPAPALVPAPVRRNECPPRPPRLVRALPGACPEPCPGPCPEPCPGPCPGPRTAAETDNTPPPATLIYV